MGPFEGTDEEWDLYVKRLESFFAANKVTDKAQKKAILLSVCGMKTYCLIRSLVEPKSTTDGDYDEAVKLVKQHLHPKPSCIVQRFRFNSRSRKEGESVAEFVADLRRLSTD